LARKQTFKEKLTFTAYTIPALFLYGLFFLVPLFLGLYYSMTDWNGISQTYNFVGLKNYLNMFSDHRISNSFIFSLRYALFLVITVNILALVLGVILNSKIRGKNFFRALYFFPAIISLVVVGLVFDQILYHAIPRIGKSL